MNRKASFPVGAKVRLRPEALDSYKAEAMRRLKDGRIGIVTGHTFPNEHPIVHLPQDGRKQAHTFGQIVVADWEVVELPPAQDATGEPSNAP